MTALERAWRGWDMALIQRDQARAERDHARELACRLEQELAHIQASLVRGNPQKEPDA